MIPIAKPTLGPEEAEAAAAVVRSGWIAQGKEVANFEANFAELVGAPYACAVANCTVGLHLALVVAGVSPGDEVITVSHSFIAAANVIRQVGAIPVFVDIEPHSFNIDPDAIAAAITPRTRAILCVHQIGMPCDLDRILPLARAHGCAVIEDAACAIGSEIWIDGSWQAIGAPHGDIACFSFHPRKVVTTGEGGMVTTRRADWDHKLRLLRQHGMSVPDTVRHSASKVIFETYELPAYNYRMTDIQAAIGLVQLGRLADGMAQRRLLAGRYQSMLASIDGLGVPVEPNGVRTNWQSYCVRLPPGVDQLTVMQAMLDRGVATRRGIMCAHLEPAYADLPARFPLRHSERAHRNCILLPLFAGMTSEEQDEVVAALRFGLAAAGAVHTAVMDTVAAK